MMDHLASHVWQTMGPKARTHNEDTVFSQNSQTPTEFKELIWSLGRQAQLDDRNIPQWVHRFQGNPGTVIESAVLVLMNGCVVRHYIADECGDD